MRPVSASKTSLDLVSITRTGLAFGAVLLLALLAVAGCANAREAPSAPPAVSTAAAGPRDVVIRADLALSVDQVRPSAEGLRRAVEAHGGFVANGGIRGRGDDATADFEVRVPAVDPTAFREEVRKPGDVDSESERTEDVTAPRADLEARLRNARAQEQRLLASMSDKPASLADVVALEKELATVRETVERLEAESRTMEESVRLATVDVSLRPTHVQHGPIPSRASDMRSRQGSRARATWSSALRWSRQQ